MRCYKENIKNLDYNMIMKKIALMTFMMLASVCMLAQKGPEIKFDKLTHNFGTFSESNPVQKCTFTFTNTGDAPSIINQAVASCGCAVPTYTKKPVAPGEKGEVSVTYNGKGKFPGHFKKTVTIRTNCANSLLRLYIEGDMQEVKEP